MFMILLLNDAAINELLYYITVINAPLCFTTLVNIKGLFSVSEALWLYTHATTETYSITETHEVTQ